MSDERMWLGDPDLERGPVVGIGRKDLDKLHDEITRLRTALTYMRDDKSMTKPTYFKRIAALALRGESIKAWASPTIGDDRGEGDA